MISVTKSTLSLNNLKILRLQEILRICIHKKFFNPHPVSFTTTSTTLSTTTETTTTAASVS